MMQPQAPPPKLNLRRLESLQRLLRYGAAAGFVVFVALVAFSVYQLRQVNRKIDAEAQTNTKLTRMLHDMENLPRTDADTIERQRDTVRALLDPSIPLSSWQAKGVERTIEENIDEIGDESKIPPRVYIEVDGADLLERAGEIARQLRARGYIVPGVENAEGQGPGISQLKYSEEGAATERDLRNLLEFFRGAGVRLYKPSLSREDGVHPRYYKIWLGSDFRRGVPPVETKPTPTPEPTREPTPRPTRKPTPEPTRERTPRPPLEPTPDRGQRNN